MSRRQATDAAVLELTLAASIVMRALPGRARQARCRLELAVGRVVVLAGAGHLDIPPPSRETAFERLAAAIGAARSAGVDWRDVVCLVNGDDER
ncbi:MAG TPA: hypothetical protein VM689_13495 [Aliidongia sp.]|nr:hypothetical protein [Aliidongia sp.]